MAGDQEIELLQKGETFIFMILTSLYYKDQEGLGGEEPSWEKAQT